jgi:DHA2 family multidrug resistance protein
MFAPLAVAAYKYLPRELRGPAAGIYAVLRNEGGSVGTSVGRTLLERRTTFHADRLVETLHPLNPSFGQAIDTGQAFYQGITGDPAGSELLALQSIEDLRQQQAALMAYLDAFFVCSVLALALIPLALLMRRSVAEAGEHAGAE